MLATKEYKMHKWAVTLANNKIHKVEADQIEVSEGILIFWIDKEISASYGTGAWISVINEQFDHCVTCTTRM